MCDGHWPIIYFGLHTPLLLTLVSFKKSIDMFSYYLTSRPILDHISCILLNTHRLYIYIYTLFPLLIEGFIYVK